LIINKRDLRCGRDLRLIFLPDYQIAAIQFRSIPASKTADNSAGEVDAILRHVLRCYCKWLSCSCLIRK